VDEKLSTSFCLLYCEFLVEAQRFYATRDHGGLVARQINTDDEMDVARGRSCFSIFLLNECVWTVQGTVACTLSVVAFPGV
jgi:hypothetical protein